MLYYQEVIKKSNPWHNTEELQNGITNQNFLPLFRQFTSLTKNIYTLLFFFLLRKKKKTFQHPKNADLKPSTSQCDRAI